MFDLEILSTLAFFALIGILIIRDRKNIEFNYGIIIRRWQQGKYLIDNLIRNHETTIRTIGTIAVVVGVLAGLFGFIFLLQSSLKLQREFGLVLPTVGGFVYPGPVVSIPFWYWIVGIFIIIASHETSHAIFARLENVPIKNYGIALFFILPIGAFVDPDMKIVEQLQPLKKLRIYAAGSFMNLMIALLIFLISLASIQLSNNLIENVGINYEILPCTPAATAELSGTIYQINNQTIKNRPDLVEFLNKTKVGEDIIIFTTDGNFQLTTIENPDFENFSYIGITNVTEIYRFKMLSSGYVPDYFITSIVAWYKLLMWIFMLNIGVGVANLLPMKPFDGGYIFEEIFNKLFKGHGKTLINITSLLTASLIIFNLFGVNLVRMFI